ncbi:DUF6950 family protein [Paenirhodobacter populi]|uniref:DUF6950 domain-containing protein n=1 Tax=Paenirhodobacter populi TaxID=2306993 RepID=A0A443IPT0_9RHOB|nr:hypothetical protein [Sinirhodobacter populi]RWR08531.1 hypothetical protein D2T33_15660 [Sinirhodobacter populi]
MTDLTRLPDWRARFAAEMDRQRQVPFEWGAHDCVSGLAFVAVEALTGVDLRPDWAGYTTAAGALKKLKSKGHNNLGEMMASLFPEIPPALARVGDLGLIPTDDAIGAGLCIFDASGVVTLTETGHGRMPREAATQAFKVG